VLDEQAAVAEALDEQLAGKPMKFQARHLEGKLHITKLEYARVCLQNQTFVEGSLCMHYCDVSIEILKL